MNSTLFLGLVLTSIFAIFGYARGNPCFELQSCVTHEYTNALSDKNIENVCRVFRKTIKCMDSKIGECAENSNEELASKIMQQRNRMVSIFKKSCGDDGIESSDECGQGLSKCSSLLTDGGNSDDSCKPIYAIKKCLKNLATSCPDIGARIKAVRDGFKARASKCPGTGNGSESVKSSYIFITVAAAVILAVRPRF